MKGITQAEIHKLFRVTPGTRVRLSRHATDWSEYPDLQDVPTDGLKGRARAFIARNLEALKEAHERLYAHDSHAVLVVLQAMDAAGKDGVIEHVMSGLNPTGCQVFSFKRPSDEELDHTFLWRCMKALPERGRIGIFNRSYYEEVLVVRVHPELIERQRLPPEGRGPGIWRARFGDINAFEKHLWRNGTRIIKIFLHVSKDEQARRFLDRIDEPDKNWKFSEGDLVERRYWSAYQRAYEEALGATSTAWAPWWIVPADHKWVCRALVSAILRMGIDALRLRPPVVDPAVRRRMARHRRAIVAELD